MEKYGKLSIFIILIPTPDFPHFHYMLGGNLGSLLYGDVSVMVSITTACPTATHEVWFSEGILQNILSQNSDIQSDVTLIISALK